MIVRQNCPTTRLRSNAVSHFFRIQGQRACFPVLSATRSPVLIAPRQIFIPLCRGAIKAGRMRAAHCQRAQRCEQSRAEAQVTALLESNRSGASVQRLLPANGPAPAPQRGAGITVGAQSNPGQMRETPGGGARSSSTQAKGFWVTQGASRTWKARMSVQGSWHLSGINRFNRRRSGKGRGLGKEKIEEK